MCWVFEVPSTWIFRRLVATGGPHGMIDLQGLDDDEDRDRCASVIIERGADTTINNSGEGQSMSAR